MLERYATGVHMTTTSGDLPHLRLASPTPATQPFRNQQVDSPMPFGRYVRAAHPTQLRDEPAGRLWPTRTIDNAPLWSSVDLRDGNQALAHPMDLHRKAKMFDLLVGIGFKDIEVGYPSASQADFDFVRSIIDGDRIPDDVTISVFTPARPELIDRTFEAVRGADRAVVHLCHATACLWREVVFGMSMNDVRRMADGAAEHMMRCADTFDPSRLLFEYSPETFNITEPEFTLELANSVAAICGARPDRPLILNLPTTVETDTPNVFADQVEWMDRNLEDRASIILSVHPHNDRGTAVASAELALLSGADRVEGTLFGNGERTGNVCLATLALNLFSRGIDPKLDFSNIDDIRATVEYCNQMPVHPRHPYVGELVYTAFSGTHQDAIAKGMAALQQRAADTDRDVRSLAWEVPYLPIDPKDVGRSYESIVRLNSQSGKGGIAHVLETRHGLHLPKALRRHFADTVQLLVDASGTELDPDRLWDVFRAEYVEVEAPLLFEHCRRENSGPGISVIVTVTEDGRLIEFHGSGADPSSALVDGMRRAGHDIDVVDVTRQAPADRSCPHGNPVYCELIVDQVRSFGVGLDDSTTAAEVRAIINAVNKVRGGVSAEPIH
ncbi:2-isopropylmalate synthase [Nocardia sp. NPDC055049]